MLHLQNVSGVYLLFSIISVGATYCSFSIEKWKTGYCPTEDMSFEPVY